VSYSPQEVKTEKNKKYGKLGPENAIVNLSKRTHRA